MQFEDFDKKVKEAADHHHPAYNEDAWGKMEKLLDKHMPEEKDDRRRFIFFILIPVLLAGSAWLLISKPWSGKKAIAKTEQSVNPNGNSTNATSTETSNDKKEETGTVTDVQSNDAPVDNARNTQTPVVNTNTGILQKQTLNTDKTVSSTGINQQFDATVSSPATKKKKTTQPGTATAIDKPIEVSAAIDNVVKTNTVIVKQDETKPVVADKPVVIENKNSINPTASTEIKSEDKKEEVKTITDKKEQVADAPVAKKEKNSSKKRSSFFISASAGPDISAAGLDRLGKVKLLAGGGLGYTFKDRLTVRTGFYTGRKVYTASPEQYNPGPTFWQYYPYMEKIDADCKVYEIPLLFTYNFGNSAKRNWFAGAGISTYLMKEEIYDYYYKSTPTGQTRHRRWTVDNENKHFFSVLTLSGGYQRNLGNKFLLMAEPFVKIPMGGVGFGNVKLNSAGLMLTVGYKPFERAKVNRKISIPANSTTK